MSDQEIPRVVPQPGSEPPRPVGLLGLIEAAGRLLARNVLVPALTYAVVYGSYPLIRAALQAQHLHPAVEPMLGALGGVAFLLADAAVLVSLRDSALGARPSAQRAYRDALRRFVPYVLTALMVVLGVGFGFLLFVVPGIIAAVSWTLALPVVVIEGAWGADAIRRSRELVRRHWWRTAVVLVLTSIKAAVVFPLLEEASHLLPEIAPLLEWLFTALLYLFGSALQVVLYLDLRLRQAQSESLRSSEAASSTARTILS